MTIALDGNNPGGMLDGAWAKRQPGYTGANGRYASFKTLSHGVDAMARLLATSYLSKGYDTPQKIANRWAPSGVDGNNSIVYAQRIAKSLGIGINDRIAVADARPLALVQARIENPKFPAKWALAQQDTRQA